MPIDRHIENLIEDLRAVAAEIGLDGSGRSRARRTRISSTMRENVSCSVSKKCSTPRSKPKAGEIHGLAADGTSVMAGAQRHETQRAVHEALQRLPDRDREILVLRGIEQMSNNKVAEILGVQPSAVTMRFQKALLRLREKLPDSVFADLADE